jgi:type I restriction-modification system DNA methylase subunit
MSAGQVRVVGEKQFNAERFGVRCRIRSSPVNNANYAWIQHFIHHLSPVGVAGFVMAKTTRNAHSCSVKITGDVRKNAAEKGSEVYAKA